jgi:hypothetical protein
MRNIDMAAS